jgi:hypothetical protein
MLLELRDRVALSILIAGIGLACARSSKIEYEHADPIADARRAFVDSGHFHTLAVRVGDSVISPSDTTAYRERSYNVEVGPEGPTIYLPLQAARTRPGWPSEAQLRYINAYNTELFALLDTNFMRVRLPPNKRLKLPARVGH